MNAIEAAKIYNSYAEILAEKYGFELEIIYTGGSRCSAGSTQNKARWFVAPDRLVVEYNRGFVEYDRVAKVWKAANVWGKNNPLYPKDEVSSALVGDKALWALALHEFAHILQNGKFKRLGGGKRDVHGVEFQEFLARLIEENPYKPNFWVDEKEQKLSDDIAYFAQFV